MFERAVDYPTAVASYDDAGVTAAISWCIQHMAAGDTLTVWTSRKSNLKNCAQLERLVSGHANVEHVSGRGGAYLRGTGPVLMAWAHMDDIGELVRNGARLIRALCVITWSEDAIRPWVTSARPTILGDSSAWEHLTAELDPVVVEALKDMTATINHSNTIAAGYEKDDVVSALLALHNARVSMDGAAMQGWALANGWSGENPEQLAKYVRAINAGTRPRCRRVLRPDYVDDLRRRAADAR